MNDRGERKEPPSFPDRTARIKQKEIKRGKKSKEKDKIRNRIYIKRRKILNRKERNIKKNEDLNEWIK